MNGLYLQCEKAEVVEKLGRNECTFFFFINYIIHCKIKRDNHQVPKIVRVHRNKINPKKIRLKIYK